MQSIVNELTGVTYKLKVAYILISAPATVLGPFIWSKYKRVSNLQVLDEYSTWAEMVIRYSFCCLKSTDVCYIFFHQLHRVRIIS